MTESAIHSRSAKLNLTVHTADHGKYYLTDSDGFVLSPGLMTQEMLEQWFDIGEVKRIEKALSDRAAKLDLMVKNDHGNFYLTDLNNCAVAPCPMTLEQIDSWLTDLEKQAEQEDKQ